MKASYTKINTLDIHDFLERIFNYTNNGIAISSLDGDWIKANDSICDLLGYTRNELFNMNTQDLVCLEDLGAHQDKYDNLIEGKVSQYQVQQRYLKKNGSIIWFLVSISLVSDKYNKPYYLIWQFTDITERKTHNVNLKAIPGLAKEQNESLIAFTNKSMHNLRSHAGNLTALIGFLDDDYPWLYKNENYGFLKEAIENLGETVLHLTEATKIKEIE